MGVFAGDIAECAAVGWVSILHPAVRGGFVFTALEYGVEKTFWISMPIFMVF
ncbi:hypothetical protein An15g03000 [Aspergillus niger]|uniref:Uncharacterized protein n=2 Tax=Aspergillus niger TaxID=5061 RepID=A2R580_ASPNC|nr:hypothetical protein An15g03000 [Aspergillus niger]CAK42375.1 hypothetical protein An15g03000 [Aspergillus niger]